MILSSSRTLVPAYSWKHGGGTCAFTATGVGILAALDLVIGAYRLFIAPSAMISVAQHNLDVLQEKASTCLVVPPCVHVQVLVKFYFHTTTALFLIFGVAGYVKTHRTAQLTTTMTSPPGPKGPSGDIRDSGHLIMVSRTLSM